MPPNQAKECIGKKGCVTEVLRTRPVTKYPSIQGIEFLVSDVYRNTDSGKSKIQLYRLQYKILNRRRNSYQGMNIKTFFCI
uniref:Uncharacterized protein n=1 Tax=Quercus lobata TaxID=97700 RepID=A0A7N2MSQ8_QUELO